MTTRVGLATLITELKTLTDVALGDTDNFADEDIQNYLDLNKTEYRDVGLTAYPIRLPGNNVTYRYYYLPSYLGRWFETPINDTINDYFSLSDSDFNPILFGTGDPEAQYDSFLRRIVFNTETSGKFYWLTAYAYDLNGAAADIWLVKLNNRISYIDIKTDNQSLAMSQEYQHCQERYQYFSALSQRNQSTRLIRVDQGVGYGTSAEYNYIRGFGPSKGY